MRKELKQRIIISAVLVIGCLLFVVWPRPLDDNNRPRTWGERVRDFTSYSAMKKTLATNIRLGLDLKGGAHLVMQVIWAEAVDAKADRNVLQARTILQKANTPFTDIKKVPVPGKGEITITVPDSSHNLEIRDKLLPDFNSNTLTGSGWTFSQSGTTVTFAMTKSELDAVATKATTDAAGIISNRVNALGLTEPSIQLGPESAHTIIVQLPGVDDIDRVKNILKVESHLELGLLVSTYPSKEAAQAAVTGKSNQVVLKYADKDAGADAYAVIETPPVITGEDLRDASAVPSRAGTDVYEIDFTLTSSGAERFYAFTSSHINQRLAIILNGEVKTAPNINGAIHDRGQITGSFSKDSAEDLALTLRSGALPAKLVYIEERTVGPSLGADSIKAGVLSSVVGLVAIVLFMLFYYRGSGINAIMALVINLIILMAGLVMLSAVLTLPGIAGVILTIGMAVDSNVLIFERVREELRNGKTVPSAIDTGFKRAFVAIIDTHVTTIVSALFLFLFGTGPIRGFAVTLAIGLLANLFSSVYVSRTMFNYVLSRKQHRAEALSI